MVRADVASDTGLVQRRRPVAGDEVTLRFGKAKNGEDGVKVVSKTCGNEMGWVRVYHISQIEWFMKHGYEIHGTIEDDIRSRIVYQSLAFDAVVAWAAVEEDTE